MKSKMIYHIYDNESTFYVDWN